MKYFFLSILFSIIISFSSAQQCPVSFAGTKTLYQPQQSTYTKAPKGYAPVFINYVGRHGARHLTKDVNTSFAYRLLQKADSLQGLTEKGKQLREMILRLEKVEKNNFKSISIEGAEELSGIATRMCNNFLQVLQAKPITNVDITKEKRTYQSASVFVRTIEGLLKRNDTVHYIVNDTTLRFFDISPVYLEFEEKGNWLKTIEQLKQTLQIDKVVEKTGILFFTSSFLATIDKKELEELNADIFGFITILPSIQEEIVGKAFYQHQLDFQSFYDCDELLKIGTLDNAEDFLLKGPGTDSLGIQVTIAAPLLMDFISATNEFIYSKGPSTRFRFAHAETIAPFAALLNIEGASTATRNIDSFSHNWKAEEVVPLSANIQWILYRKKRSKNFLVKILLNEKEVAINGLATSTFPYYPLLQLKEFYMTKLHTLGLNMGDNYYQYLLGLK